MNWAAISNIASIVTILSFIPILWSLIILFGIKRKRYSNQKKIREGDIISDSAILIVDIGEGFYIRETVERWVYSQPKFEGFSSEDVYYIDLKKRIEESDINKFLDRLRDTRDKILSKGVKNIHLFYRGPVAISAIIGAEFSNGYQKVFLYQNDNTTPDGYVNLGTLRR
ncbi:MAG: hypothetical protein N3B21_06010 [Clostridia bacterium]|nr:hypothetical protein [Clostridia bacterium]